MLLANQITGFRKVQYLKIELTQEKYLIQLQIIKNQVQLPNQIFQASMMKYVKHLTLGGPVKC